MSFIIYNVSFSQSCFTIISWNIRELGDSKNKQEIDSILYYIQDGDLIALQEVVAGDGGIEKVEEIVMLLNAKEQQFNYRISEPTNSPSNYIRERYAFIWNIKKINLQVEPHLDLEIDTICDREPYVGHFITVENSYSFDVLNFHARTNENDPQSEIRALATYPSRRQNDNIIILGDFNTNERDRAWKRLYQQNFSVCLVNRLTTLKVECTSEGEYKNNDYDNIYYYTPNFHLKRKGVIDFVGDCENLSFARQISDHLPVFVEFRLIR